MICLLCNTAADKRGIDSEEDSCWAAISLSNKSVILQFYRQERDLHESEDL